MHRWGGRLRDDHHVNSAPYTIVEEPTFVARFLLGADDAAGSVANVDAFVDLPDGSSWALTIVTIDEVRRLLRKWHETGEVAHGSYFWVIDQLIVPRPGIPAMTTAIRELVRSEDLARAGIRCETDLK
jgi:hypothetical protein